MTGSLGAAAARAVGLALPAARPEAAARPGAAGRPAEAPTPAARLARVRARLGRLMAGRAGYALAFALCYLLAWVPALGVLAAEGKSMIWNFDGLYQQYVWFVYTGQWLREAARALFVERTLDIPTWTMSLGFGSDLVQTVLCTAVNPFYAVSALVPERHAEVAFEASMLVQLYLAGLAFSAWAVGHEVERPFALAGAVTYSFSGSMAVLFTQPGFLNAPLLFPLILFAADRMLEGRGRALYTALLAWSLAYSFYDTYMMAVMLVMYCVLMFFARVDRPFGRAGRARRLLKAVGTFAGWTLLALLISSVLLLPQVMALVGLDRLELDRADALLYEPNYYVNLVMGYTTYFFATGDAYAGLGALAVPAAVALAVRARRHKALAAAFCVLTLMLLLPVCGRVMNAMQYPTNRWAWAYSLCGAYLVARMAPEMLALKGRGARVLLAALAVYAAACLALPVSGRAKIAALVALAAVAVARLPRLSRRGAAAVLVAAAVASGSMSFAWYLAPGLGDGALGEVDAGGCWPAHTSDGAPGLVAQAASSPEGYDASYRYDRASAVSRVHNSALVTGLMAADFYNSMYSSGIDRLWSSLGLTDTWGINIGYGALNGRGALEGLLGARYYYLPAGAEALLPCTFADGRVAAQGEGGSGPSRRLYALYETELAAPLATVRRSVLSESAYEGLSMAERQEALLQAVVLEDGEAPAGTEDVSGSLVLESRELPFELACSEGCSYEDGRVVVSAPWASIALSYEAGEESECYVELAGLRYEDTVWEGETFARQCLTTKSLSAYLRLYADGAPVSSSKVSVLTPGHPIYGGKADWLCNMGSQAAGAHTATVVFESPGTYTLSSLRVVAQPVEPVLEQVGALVQAGASDIALGADRLSCTAEAPEGGLVFWSVAYSEGWSATVDGEPAQVLLADLGFMAVPVGPGEHEVVLTYRTPWLAEGACLTAAGLAAAVGLALLRRRRSRAAYE